MKKLYTRLAADRSRISLKDVLKGQHGAVDVASAAVGVLIIGIIGSVIAATVFLIIPWTQDHASRGSLGAIATAEGAYYSQSAQGTLTTSGNTNNYANLADLQTEKLIGSGVNSVAVKGGSAGWVAVTKSGSGKWFVSTNANTVPTVITPAPAASATLTTVLDSQVGTATGTPPVFATLGTENVTGP